MHDINKEAQLETLALAAQAEWNSIEPTITLRYYHTATNPTEVLELLNTIKQLRNEVLENNAIASELAEALTAVGLPKKSSIKELIGHHRANASLAGAFDGLKEANKIVIEELEYAAIEYKSGQLSGVFMGKDDYTKEWLLDRAEKLRNRSKSSNRSEGTWNLNDC